jgi:hypothetical protein
MRSDDDEDNKQANAGAGDAPDGGSEGGEQEPEPEQQEDEDEDEEDGAPRQITLDRYLSRRRPRSGGWGHLVAAVLMLVTLVLIIVYKDRCGSAVSGLMGEIGGEESKRPPARIELEAPKKSE